MFNVLFFSIWLVFHPVHVTITSIDYVPEMDSFKVFVRMNFDDFFLDCKLFGGDIQKKDFSENISSSRNVMERYIGEKIFIKINDKLISGKLKEMKLIDNEISMNLEYYSHDKPKNISVKNLIMTSLYTDQANMVIVRINDFEQGVKLTAEINENTFIMK